MCSQARREILDALEAKVSKDGSHADEGKLECAPRTGEFLSQV